MKLKKLEKTIKKPKLKVEEKTSFKIKTGFFFNSQIQIYFFLLY